MQPIQTSTKGVKNYNDSLFSKKELKAIITTVWIITSAPVVFVFMSIISYHIGHTLEKPVIYNFTVKAVVIDIYCFFYITNLIYCVSEWYRIWIFDKSVGTNSQFEDSLF